MHTDSLSYFPRLTLPYLDLIPRCKQLVFFYGVYSDYCTCDYNLYCQEYGSPSGRPDNLFAPTDINTEALRVRERGPYTLTLVAVDNPVGVVADFTSILEVMVDDIDDAWYKYHMSDIWRSSTHAHL